MGIMATNNHNGVKGHEVLLLWGMWGHAPLP